MLTKTTADGAGATLVAEPRKTSRAVKPANESVTKKAAKPLTIFIDGEFVAEEDAKISVFDHGLLYGDGIFEGIRFYNGRVFRLKDHLDRLWDSARSICLEIPMSHGEMTEALLETIRKNDLRDGYIRLIVTRGVGNLGLNPAQCKRPSVIIIATTIALYSAEMYQNGLTVVTVPTHRTGPGALNPAVKSLNYLNNVMARIEANLSGADEALMLNDQGCIAECTADNIFVIKRGEISTPPITAGALRGITRSVVFEIAAELGIKEKVLFVGERHDIPAMLASLDVSVLISGSESLSNVILESMAAGVPVVATNVGGNPELVKDGKTGLLVPPGDENMLVQAMAHLVRDLMARCRAFLFPGLEDFGIAPVEVQASGRPVIAYAQGGALETLAHVANEFLQPRGGQGQLLLLARPDQGVGEGLIPFRRHGDDRQGPVIGAVRPAQLAAQLGPHLFGHLHDRGGMRSGLAQAFHDRRQVARGQIARGLAGR